jgi:hypothetical protein
MVKSLDRYGRFVVCDAPIDTPLSLSIVDPSVASSRPPVAVELSWGEFRWIDLKVNQ